MDPVTNFFSQHLHGVSMSIVATLLVIFGNDINRFIRRMVKNNHFMVRLGVFVLVCAFGYGMATLFLTGILVKSLATIPKQFLTMGIVLIFIVLGLIAESRRQI